MHYIINLYIHSCFLISLLVSHTSKRFKEGNMVVANSAIYSMINCKQKCFCIREALLQLILIFLLMLFYKAPVF